MSLRCKILGHNIVHKPFVMVDKITLVGTPDKQPIPIFCRECTCCDLIELSLIDGQWMSIMNAHWLSENRNMYIIPYGVLYQWENNHEW